MNDSARQPSEGPMGRRAKLSLFALIAAILLVAAPALADAVVQVELRDGSRPVAGTVTLSGGGRTFSCTAGASGSCTISGVPGGMYQVTVAPATGAAPRPRSAMIPPAGTTRLIVAAH